MNGKSKTFRGEFMVKKSNKLLYVVIIPTLVIFFLLHTMPLLQGLFYSFTDFGGFGDWEFVGLNNYIEGFQDSRIIHSYFFYNWFFNCINNFSQYYRFINCAWYKFKYKIFKYNKRNLFYSVYAWNINYCLCF